MSSLVSFFPALRSSAAPRFSVTAFLKLRHQRSALAHLSDEILDDIGITRAQADAEAERPIWDAPNHWHD